MEDRPAEGASKMKEKDSPSVAEKIARLTGVGLVVGAGALPDTRPIQASEIQKHIDSPNKHELNLEQGMPSANALLEAGFQIGGTLRQAQSTDVQSYSTPGVEHVGTSGIKAKNTAENKIETSQTITETLQNLLVSKEQREQNPVQIYDMFLEENAQGEIQTMYFVARYQNSEGGGDSGIGRYIYRTQLDTQTGKFTKAAAISKELPIAARTIAVSGQKKLIGGENPIRSASPALLLTKDDGQTFTPITTHIRQGVINESQVITSTNQAILNIWGFETSGSLESFSFNSESLTKINWDKITGVTTRESMGLGTLSSGTVDIYTTVYDGVLSSGYLKITADLSTGQATAERKHTDWGYLDAFYQLKDSTGQITNILATNNDRQSLYIQDISTNTPSEMPYYNWLDAWAQANGITNYDPGSLRLKYVQVVNNTTWAMGTFLTTDSRSGAVAISWPWGENPNTNSNVLTVSRLSDTLGNVAGQKNTKWGRFNGKSGFLINMRPVGLMLLETKSDGSPLINPAILNIDNGMGELPQPPTPTPTPERPFRVYLPVGWRNLVTSSWRKINKLVRSK